MKTVKAASLMLRGGKKEKFLLHFRIWGKERINRQDKVCQVCILKSEIKVLILLLFFLSLDKDD